MDDPKILRAEIDGGQPVVKPRDGTVTVEFTGIMQVNVQAAESDDDAREQATDCVKTFLRHRNIEWDDLAATDIEWIGLEDT
jgi:hypothetical protein